MLKSKHFKTEKALLDWVNSWDAPRGILFDTFRGIIKDNSNGDFILFYIDIQ